MAVPWLAEQCHEVTAKIEEALGKVFIPSPLFRAAPKAPRTIF
jgi:hypothetical protein